MISIIQRKDFAGADVYCGTWGSSKIDCKLCASRASSGAGVLSFL